MLGCPRCGSSNIHVVNEVKTEGFGFFEGCLGFLILGPIGLLCGLCGMGETKNNILRVCGNCGCKFR